jgi:hypothetical protein
VLVLVLSSCYYKTRGSLRGCPKDQLSTLTYIRQPRSCCPRLHGHIPDLGSVSSLDVNLRVRTQESRPLAVTVTVVEKGLLQRESYISRPSRSAHPAPCFVHSSLMVSPLSPDLPDLQDLPDFLVSLCGVLTSTVHPGRRKYPVVVGQKHASDIPKGEQEARPRRQMRGPDSPQGLCSHVRKG